MVGAVLSAVTTAVSVAAADMIPSVTERAKPVVTVWPGATW